MPALIAIVSGLLGFWLGHAVARANAKPPTVSIDREGNVSVVGAVEVKMPKGKATIVDMSNPLDIDLGEKDQPKTQEQV
jgi:hypothetical protein